MGVQYRCEFCDSPLTTTTCPIYHGTSDTVIKVEPCCIPEDHPLHELALDVLMEHINNLAEQGKKWETQSLIENLEWEEQVSYYHNDIQKELQEWFEITPELAAHILEECSNWPEDVLEYTESGFPYCSPGEFALYSIGEIIIDSETIIKDWNIDSENSMIREWINDNCDIYIDQNGNGIINASYDSINLVFDKLKTQFKELP